VVRQRYGQEPAPAFLGFFVSCHDGGSIACVRRYCIVFLQPQQDCLRCACGSGLGLHSVRSAAPHCGRFCQPWSLLSKALIRACKNVVNSRNDNRRGNIFRQEMV
jgi:hypothetical protein